MSLSKQVADEQVNLFMDSYEIEIDAMPEKIRFTIEMCTGKLTKDIMKGRLEITKDKKISITQHLMENEGDADTITYGALTGSAKSGMKDSMSEHEKVYALMSGISGETLNTIKKLQGLDHSAMENLGLIFLQI